MGTVQDLFKQNSHDYVDNPYWSAMQIKVRRFGTKDAQTIGSIDKGKVLLFCNLTCDHSMEEETKKQLAELRRVAEKYQGDLAVYG